MVYDSNAKNRTREGGSAKGRGRGWVGQGDGWMDEKGAQHHLVMPPRFPPRATKPARLTPVRSLRRDGRRPPHTTASTASDGMPLVVAPCSRAGAGEDARAPSPLPGSVALQRGERRVIGMCGLHA